MARDRDRHLQELVASEARRKVVVAGPGTGKTHSFRALLEEQEGDKLVLTFINNLVEDLTNDLGDVARVQTLHAFARWLLHRSVPEGLSSRFLYYPLLKVIHRADTTIMLGQQMSTDDVSAVLQTLDETNEILTWILRSGNYYDAVGYDDSVYRLVAHLRGTPDAIPEFALVIVDEFQDFNPLEVALIRHLYDRYPTLVVGDDDQALYSFKFARSDYLRDLARSADFQRFSLPYCSRCPDILVRAVHRVVEVAKGDGLLSDRLDKPFVCYMPEKREDSEAYPKVIHARCTVHTSRSPLMARYVERRVQEIPPDEVAQSWERGGPTALVIGPSWVAKQVFEYLEERLPNVSLALSPGDDIDPLVGYELLAEDERSRLGWRILMLVSPPEPPATAVVPRALEEGEELVDLLSDDYRRPHLEVVAFLRRLREGEDLESDEEGRLSEAVDRTPSELRYAIGLEEAQEEPEPDHTEPSVMVASLVGAKGRQASHVFVVGMNEGQFPRSIDGPTEDEVCQFIVALTRATKSCHLVSSRRYADLTNLGVSRFVGWLGDAVDTTSINAAWFDAASQS